WRSSTTPPGIAPWSVHAVGPPSGPGRRGRRRIGWRGRSSRYFLSFSSHLDREAEQLARLTKSALHSGCVGGDVIELQRERDGRVHTHQDGDVRDAIMTEDLDRAVVQALGDVAASGQGRGQLIDGLLPLILQKCRLAAEQGIYDL